jgi:3-hydroxyisobutyrate dehydrogenase-like beta-hydroxyacid dehydrogenase
MAERLVRCDVPTTVWARRTEALAPFAGRAAVADDLVALGRASDVLGVCVTDGAAVRSVVLGAEGALSGMTPGSVLAIHSTIGPEECAPIADAAAERGVLVVDAPVSGGGAAAAAGGLTVYVGGDDDAVARAHPVLDHYGETVLHMGPLGSGLRTKLLNNALVAAHFALASDAMTTGAALGLNQARLAEALRSGRGRSFSLEVFVGLGSFDAIADHVGPIMGKDIGLFEAATRTAPDRATLLDPADRFLALVGHPRRGDAAAVGAVS